MPKKLRLSGLDRARLRIAKRAQSKSDWNHSRRRLHRVHVDLSDEEKVQLEELCDALGEPGKPMAQSEVIRWLISAERRALAPRAITPVQA
jgi:hypothetical protein